MGFSPNIQTREQRSQATPLAEDVLRMIQGHLSGPMAGMGFGPMQQGAGTAIQQFVNSGGSHALPAVRDIGPAGAEFGKMVSAMEQVQNRRVNEQAGNLREQAGAAGTRYGTTLGTAEGGMRRDAQADFNVTLGQLAQQLDEARRADSALGIQRDLGIAEMGLNKDQQMLQAIMSMYGMGQGNMAPIFQMAQQGIMPDNLMVSPGIGSQLLSGFMNLGSNMMPVAGQWLMNRGQGGGGPFNPTMPNFALPEWQPQWSPGTR